MRRLALFVLLFVSPAAAQDKSRYPEHGEVVKTGYSERTERTFVRQSGPCALNASPSPYDRTNVPPPCVDSTNPHATNEPTVIKTWTYTITTETEILTVRISMASGSKEPSIHSPADFRLKGTTLYIPNGKKEEKYEVVKREKKPAKPAP